MPHRLATRMVGFSVCRQRHMQPHQHTPAHTSTHQHCVHTRSLRRELDKASLKWNTVSAKVFKHVRTYWKCRVGVCVVGRRRLHADEKGRKGNEAAHTHSHTLTHTHTHTHTLTHTHTHSHTHTLTHTANCCCPLSPAEQSLTMYT